VGVAFYLLPKTPPVVVSSLVLIFVLLIHPIWNFWWVEARLWRKFAATLLFILALICLGRSSWPSGSGSLLQFAAHLMEGFWRWMVGPHGRWFDRSVGAAYSVAVIMGLVLLGRMLNARRLSPRVQPQKGFLDYRLEAETAMSAMPAMLEKLTAIMTEVGPAMEKHTKALERASSTAEQLRVSKLASSSLDRYSIRVDRVSARFVENGDLLSEGLIGWSKWIEEAGSPKASFGDFPEVLRHLIGNLSVANDHLTEYIATTSHVKGASSVLNAAVDRHIRSWELIVHTNRRIHEACDETLKILDGLT